jgi:hypothetical protein
MTQKPSLPQPVKSVSEALTPDTTVNMIGSREELPAPHALNCTMWERLKHDPEDSTTLPSNSARVMNLSIST